MITLISERYYLTEEGTYELCGTEQGEVSQEHYDNYVSSRDFFRSLGGTELLEEHSEGTTLTSFSPDRLTKIVRTFYRTVKMGNCKYKLYNDNNSFNIEFDAKATLADIQSAMGLPVNLRVRLVGVIVSLAGTVKEYRQDKTGFTFSIREVF